MGGLSFIYGTRIDEVIFLIKGWCQVFHNNVPLKDEKSIRQVFIIFDTKESSFDPEQTGG